MKLSKIEYYNRLIELLDISAKKIQNEEDIKQIEDKNNSFIEMYEQYCEEKGPSKGDEPINLDDLNYLLSLRTTGDSSFANGWAIFSNLKAFLLKRDIFLDQNENRKAIYNNRIAYKLAKQINLPLAKYRIRKNL